MAGFPVIPSLGMSPSARKDVRHTSGTKKKPPLVKRAFELYDLSQKGEKIYLKAKPEPRKRLLKMVFSRMVLDEGRLITTYSKAFRLLFEAVRATNSSKVDKLPPKRVRKF